MDKINMDAVYQEYATLIYRFLYTHTHDADWSQELMQETFLRAVDSISRYDGSCKLSVWLCQIAKHVMWQELRKRKRFDTVAWTEDFPDTQGQDGEGCALQQEQYSNRTACQKVSRQHLTALRRYADVPAG